jgi:hypothetical protein
MKLKGDESARYKSHIGNETILRILLNNKKVILHNEARNLGQEKKKSYIVVGSTVCEEYCRVYPGNATSI